LDFGKASTDSPHATLRFDESQLKNDPFDSTGFITAFSQSSLQPMGAFTLTSRTFPGDLAELERMLGELGIDNVASKVFSCQREMRWFSPRLA
jgi:hypothetical protein